MALVSMQTQRVTGIMNQASMGGDLVHFSRE